MSLISTSTTNNNSMNGIT